MTACNARALVLVQLISTTSNGTSLVLYSVRTLYIWASLHASIIKIGSYGHLIDYTLYPGTNLWWL